MIIKSINYKTFFIIIIAYNLKIKYIRNRELLTKTIKQDLINKVKKIKN